MHPSPCTAHSSKTPRTAEPDRTSTSNRPTDAIPPFARRSACLNIQPNRAVPPRPLHHPTQKQTPIPLRKSPSKGHSKAHYANDSPALATHRSSARKTTRSRPACHRETSLRSCGPDHPAVAETTPKLQAGQYPPSRRRSNRSRPTWTHPIHHPIHHPGPRDQQANSAPTPPRLHGTACRPSPDWTSPSRTTARAPPIA